MNITKQTDYRYRKQSDCHQWEREKESSKIWRETVETVAGFIFGGSKITADGDCSHEITQVAPVAKNPPANAGDVRDLTQV